jgi:hypothetical protein
LQACISLFCMVAYTALPATAMPYPCLGIVEEVGHIVGKAAPRIVRSGVVDTATGGSTISEIRTSSGMFFERAEDPVIESEWQFRLLCHLTGLRLVQLASNEKGS